MPRLHKCKNNSELISNHGVVMKIKTITCHDVYNVGASLQAYALAAYLRKCGHEVEIINYKPDYLSNHFRLFWVKFSTHSQDNYRYKTVPSFLIFSFGFLNTHSSRSLIFFHGSTFFI